MTSFSAITQANNPFYNDALMVQVQALTHSEYMEFLNGIDEHYIQQDLPAECVQCVQRSEEVVHDGRLAGCGNETAQWTVEVQV